MGEAAQIEPLTVTIAETVRLTGVGRTTIYQLIGDGRLRATKIGTRTLIDFQSIKSLIREPSASDKRKQSKSSVARK